MKMNITDEELGKALDEFAVKSFERAGRGFPQRNGTCYNLRCSSKPQRFTV